MERVSIRRGRRGRFETGEEDEWEGGSSQMLRAVTPAVS